VDAAAILERTYGVLNARQVIGDPYEKNGTMVLPVVCIRGGGGGGGDESGEARRAARAGNLLGPHGPLATRESEPRSRRTEPAGTTRGCEDADDG
jgi:hypothetical protein